MTHATTYGDLGDYIVARRTSDKNNGRKDESLRHMFTAWNRLAKDLPDLAAMTISNDRTDEVLERFRKSAQDDLSNATIANYEKGFRGAVTTFLTHLEQTGSKQSLLEEPTGGNFTYGHLGDYLAAYCAEEPQSPNGRHWGNAFKSVRKRVGQLDNMTISPEVTEQILDQFRTAANNEGTLRTSTVNSYCTSFRQAVRAYSTVVPLHYPEPPVNERRARALTKTRRNRSVPVKPEASEPDMAEQPSTETTDTTMAEYTFLLRSSTPITVRLPDNLTQAEANRFHQWINSFVIAP